MFKILLKKQFSEIFRSCFYNIKTGKHRSKTATVIIVVLYLLLILGILCGSFTAMAIGISTPLYSAGAGCIYFILFGLISLAAGLFGSVFNTYSSLYLARDNDLLFSLPIPARIIVASRLFTTYLMGLLYSSTAFVPATVVWQVICGFDISSFIGNIAMLLEISLIVWILSCLFGFAVAKISLRLKNRSFVAVFAALLFIGLYYFVYFKAPFVLKDICINAVSYSQKLKGCAYLLYAWGQNGIGSLSEMLCFTAFCLIAAAVTLIILSKTFFNTATASHKEKKNAAEIKAAKVNSISRALLKKEFSRFTSSSNYMLNCGLGALFITVLGIVLIIKGNTIVSSFVNSFGNDYSLLTVILSGIICIVEVMNDSASASVSLEGKSLWIIKSLPVDLWQIIKAKIKVQLYLTEIPAVVLCVGIALIPLPALNKIICIIISLLFPVFSALFNMYIGLKMPIFNWTSEIVPIKQSGAVLIALLGGWGYSAVLIGAYALLSSLFSYVNTVIYLTVFSLLTLFLIIFLYKLLKKKGFDIFNSL